MTGTTAYHPGSAPHARFSSLFGKIYVYLGATGQSLGRGEHFTATHWALVGAGLVAKAAVSLYLARFAQKRSPHRRKAVRVTLR